MTAPAGRLRTVVLGVALLALATPAAGQSAATLVPFEIKDQFRRAHRHTDYAGRILVMIASDRKGSAYTDRWQSAIQDSLRPESGSDVVYLPVADVRGVPFFLKGYVRGRFPHDENAWILLDWSGHLARAYGFARDSVNILVFASDGTLAGRAHARELDAEVLTTLLTTLRGLRSRSDRGQP